MRRLTPKMNNPAQSDIRWDLDLTQERQAGLVLAAYRVLLSRP
jgi:hypothetical protein